MLLLHSKAIVDGLVVRRKNIWLMLSISKLVRRIFSYKILDGLQVILGCVIIGVVRFMQLLMFSYFPRSCSSCKTIAAHPVNLWFISYLSRLHGPRWPRTLVSRHHWSTPSRCHPIVTGLTTNKIAITNKPAWATPAYHHYCKATGS